ADRMLDIVLKRFELQKTGTLYFNTTRAVVLQDIKTSLKGRKSFDIVPDDTLCKIKCSNWTAALDPTNNAAGHYFSITYYQEESA
ncbi:hypothetical protein PENTCL1PPCAC_21533, partial [Pristionchus entomophagus]